MTAPHDGRAPTADASRDDAHAAERRAARLLEQMSDAHIVLDREFRVVDANAAAERLLGVAKEAFLGRTHWEAWPSSAGSEVQRQYTRVRDEGVDAQFAFHYRGPDYDAHLEIAAYPTAEGGVAVFWRDVSDRVRAESALRASEERYALASRATNHAIWDWDLRTNELLWTDGVHDLFGYERGAVPSGIAWWYDAVHPDDRDRVVRGIHALIDGADGGTVWSDEYRFRRGDGTYAVTADRGYVARDAAGVAVRMIGAMSDVTAERAAAAERERLLRAESRARASAEAAHERTRRLQALTSALARARSGDEVATVVVSTMTKVLEARTGAMAVPAAEGDALLLLRTEGFSDSALARVARQPLHLRSPLVESFTTQSAIWVERRDGPEGLDARYPVIAPIWDALGVASAAFVPLLVAGAVVGVISFSWPTPRRFSPGDRAFLHALGGQAALAVERARLFDAERRAREEAERANRAKSDFLAVMSHELRTPLNAIGGYAELLALGIRGPVSEPQLADLRRIQVSQRHLLGLINEVLNYAKLETGTVDFAVEPVSLREVVAASVGLIAPQAEAKGIELEVDDGPPALAARADADKVRQVVVNLLSNAVKFTDRGGAVRVECAAEGDRVLVRVRDTGIGIPADKRAQIFEPFVQVRADLTRTAEGTGLGLAISRDLARGMGGDLTVESEVGVGSTFTLALPTA